MPKKIYTGGEVGGNYLPEQILPSIFFYHSSPLLCMFPKNLGIRRKGVGGQRDMVAKPTKLYPTRLPEAYFEKHRKNEFFSFLSF